MSRDLPLLGGIAGFIRWLEELVNLLSGPLLTLGLGISLVDLLTDGKLLTTLPVLLFAWAISQAVGVDAQLVGAFDRARQAIRERRWWSLVGLLTLGTALGYVAFVAAQVFALQQADGISTTQALQRLGMDQTGWLIQRSLLSVVLVALSGFNRYRPQETNHKDEKSKLERELELEPLRQRVRESKATGFAALARNTIAAAKGTASDTQDATPPPDQEETSTNTAPDRSERAGGSNGREADAKPARKAPATRKKARGTHTASVEAKARAAWTPGMTVGELERAAKISRNAASKWRRVFNAETKEQRDQ